jgi:cytoskeleton protein RodZ
MRPDLRVPELQQYIAERALTFERATTWDVDMRYHTRKDLPLTGIGAQLRRRRLGLSLAIEDISRETKIASHYLDSIEQDDFESLPSLVFTRSFVRQFAESLKMDPEPLLAQLPTQNEAPVKLPDPPSRPRSAYYRDRQIRSALTAVAWLLAAGVTAEVWLHSTSTRASNLTPNPAASEKTLTAPGTSEQTTPEPVRPALSHPVQVVITAHQSAWVQMSADGKDAFTGVLKADEMKEIAADEQVKLVAGNAGALTVSLNGKTLEPLGPVGEVRVVRLTAGGPQFLARSRPPAPDPL